MGMDRCVTNAIFLDLKLIFLCLTIHSKKFLPHTRWKSDVSRVFDSQKQILFYLFFFFSLSHLDVKWSHSDVHEGRLALIANSLIPDRWTETKQASPLHAVWRRHFIWDFSTSSACHSSVKHLNKLDFVHIKRECNVLCFWSMNYSCTFSNLQKEWINLTEFQQNYRYISKHAYFTFLNKICHLEKNIWLLCPVLPHWYYCIKWKLRCSCN